MVRRLCLAKDQKERTVADTGCRNGENEKRLQPGCTLQASQQGIAEGKRVKHDSQGLTPWKRTRHFSADSCIESCEIVVEENRGQTGKRRGLRIPRDLVKEEK